MPRRGYLGSQAWAPHSGSTATASGGRRHRRLSACLILFSTATFALVARPASQALERADVSATPYIAGGNSSDYILLAQAQPSLPQWEFERILPPSTELPRDKQRPPAVIGFYFRMIPHEGWTVTWTDKVKASGQTLTQESGQHPDSSMQLFFPIDPCRVAGLDTPGTEIPITYEFVFSATHGQAGSPLASFRSWTPPIGNGNFILKLAPDTRQPSISSVNAPSTVQPDQTIRVAISATDVSDEMGGDPVWDSGLRYFHLIGPSNPGGSGLQTHTVDNDVPQTCGEKVKRANHSFSYTVPHSAQPGEVITLQVEAEDWSGNKGVKEVTLKVPERQDKDARRKPRGGNQQNSCTQSKVVRGREYGFLCP